MACNHHFFPIAFETFGSSNQVGADFISALGHRISTHTDDPRETYFLSQRLSVTIQRFNAACFANSILRWKCDVTSRDTPSSCFFHS